MWGLVVLLGYWIFVTRETGFQQDYREYPTMGETGWLSFDDWQKRYGGNSELDYQDWLIGV